MKALKSLKAKDLVGIRTAEETLARKEVQQLKESLPPGHPLLQDANAEEMRSGDLTGLPDNHPLKMALKEARERMLASEASKKPEEQEIRKAKRLQEQDIRRKQLDVEEETRQNRLDAYKIINTHIDETMSTIDKLLATIQLDESMFGEDRYSMMKVIRLQRMMQAVRSGLIDSKLRIREG